MRQGEPWFEDGNIILYTLISRQDRPQQSSPATCFRVHRGFLARQSEVFSTLLDIPQPQDDTQVIADLNIHGAEGELLKGCQFVQMHDDAMQLANLLKALYDGFSTEYNSIDNFFYIAGILHLSTKYLIASLRKKAIAVLAQTWSYTLEGHDAMVERALREDLLARPAVGQQSSAGPFRYPYAHPLHVLNLARTLDVPVLVPCALYFLSVYPLADILRADHPKLLHGHEVMGGALTWMLSREDLENVALMNEHRISIMLDFTRTFLALREPSMRCTSSTHINTPGQNLRALGQSSCARGFASLSSKASRSWFPRTNPLRWMQQVVRMADRDDMLCGACRRELQTVVEEHRRKLWKELPGVVRMPDWEMLAEDESN